MSDATHSRHASLSYDDITAISNELIAVLENLSVEGEIIHIATNSFVDRSGKLQHIGHVVSRVTPPDDLTTRAGS